MTRPANPFWAFGIYEFCCTGDILKVPVDECSCSCHYEFVNILNTIVPRLHLCLSNLMNHSFSTSSKRYPFICLFMCVCWRVCVYVCVGVRVCSTCACVGERSMVEGMLVEAWFPHWKIYSESQTHGRVNICHLGTYIHQSASGHYHRTECCSSQ